ncbi:MAG: TonB-dependent receptor [Lysobacterales bacterium]
MTRSQRPLAPISTRNHHRIQRRAVSAAVAAALAFPAYAQNNSAPDEVVEDEMLEEMVVKGVRQSLQNARAIKRDADTFVDAISASDINALPDVSVLEALQRVPGISIERFASPNDPDHFSTEGSGAILRGLPQTRTSLNGRDTFSANSSRGLSFQDIPPELTGAVKIFKNQTADMVEGGISGTIDLITRKPFDAEGQVMAFSAQANAGDIADETTGGFAGLYSNRFELDSGAEIGVLFSYSNTDLDFQSDGVEAGQHNLVADAAGSGQDRFVPINGGIRSNFTERSREGIAATVQYGNANDTFSGLLQYIRSDSGTDWLERAFFSDDQGGTVGAGAVFDGNSFTSGVISNVANGFGPQTRQSQTDSLVEDLSLKLEFRPTDRLAITGDVQFIDATTDVTDLTVFAGLLPVNGNGIDIGLDLSQSVPDVTFMAPAGSGQTDQEFFNDPSNYFWRAAMDHLEESEGDELALALDVDYTLFDSGFARSVEAGVRFAERDQTTRWSTFNWGNLSEAWNGGFATFDGQRNQAAFNSPAAGQFTFSDFHGGNAGGIPGGTGLFPNAELVANYDAFLQGIAPFGRTDLAGRGGVVDNFYLPAEINETTEENTAFYVKLNFETDDPRLKGNVGLRYVNVDTTVGGGITFPTLNPNAAAFASADEVAFANGTSNTAAAESSYDTILPSLNAKYAFDDDLFLRFGYSKAISFPDLGNLRYNFNINPRTVTDADGNPDIIGWNQNSGNPFLEPMEADNFDLSIEKYFGRSDFVSFGIFYKDISNFFATDTVPTTVTNPSNGASAIVDINQPINVGDANIKGAEFAYQQFFDSLPGVWSGLGVQFNMTYVQDSDVPNQNTRAVQASSSLGARTSIPFEGLPLQGVSELTYNLIGIFENDKVQARLAYNWRDDYLLTIRQVNLGLPVFNESRGQLDGSIFYRFSPNWEVGLQGTNLLKEEVVTRMQVDQVGNQVFRSSFVFDRRLALMLRASF